MKNIFALFLFFIFTSSCYCQKYFTRSGEIKFEANMAAFEEVAAKNNSTSCILDTSTGEIAVLVLIKGFRFKIPLMEEHFNENYMESDQFPKATFKGKIINFSNSKLAISKNSFDLEGDLSIHGITQKIKTKIFLSSLGQKIISTATFKIKPIDFKIKIPSIVRNKIAETVEIDLKFDLELKP